MNVGMKFNNMLVSSVPNKLNESNKIINMDKGAFLNMMSLIINQNHSKQPSNSQSNVNNELNIMNLISGSNTSNLVDFNNLNAGLCDEVDLKDAENEENKQLEKTLSNFMYVVNYFNYDEKGNDDDEKIQSTIDNFITAEKNPSINLKESQNFKFETLQQNTVKEAKVQPEISFDTVKLIEEIEGKSDKVKNKDDINGIPFILKDTNIQGENKIITVTDESTQIKSQVLNQIKDKVVFMTEEGTGSHNGIKQVTMQLQPHDLGKVDIKMTFEDNKITVEIKALNEETQKLLFSKSDDLINILHKTTDSQINVVVKNEESLYKNQHLNYQHNHHNQHRYNENYDQQNGHGRNKNYYYKEDNKEDSDDDIIFSELINLRNLKLQL